MRGFESSRLRRGEWIVGAGSLVLLASMVLIPWYGLTRASGGSGPSYFVAYSVDGWNGLTHGHWLVVLTVAVGFGLFFFQGTRKAPALPVTLSLFVTVLGVLTTLWLLYRDFISTAGGLKLGAIIGLLSAGAVAAGGWDSLHTDGIAAKDAPAEIPTISPGQHAVP